MNGADPLPVLVVEDDAAVRVLVTRVLESRGYPVKATAFCVEALEWLAISPFLALLVDKNLPQMSGLELASRVRTQWPALPIVLMTAFPESGMLAKAHIDGYLPKPFRNLDDVGRAIEAARERRARAVEVLTLQTRLSSVQESLRGPKPADEPGSAG